MKQAATQQLFAYWNDLRAARAAPERSRIDPVMIRGCLSDTFMLEIDAPAPAAMKLTGTRLNAIFCRNMKGQTFLDLWDGDTRADIDGLLHAVLGQACVLVGGVRGLAAGAGLLDFELLLLPLRHNGKTHARVLGALAPLGIPAWIGLVPVTNLKLTAWRLLSQETLASALPLREGPAHAILAPDWRQPMGHNSMISRRNHLFVHQGGKNP